MKILLVRLFSMGDLIHTLPAVEDLSRLRPDIRLHWLSEAGFADIARLHPFMKKIHEMRWRRWRKQLFKSETRHEMSRLKKELQQEKLDSVLDSQGFIKSALSARMADAQVKGLDKNSFHERLAALAYDQTFDVLKGKNAVWCNRELFAQVFNYQIPQLQRFGLSVPAEGRPKNLKAPYYVALYTTNRDSKLWPVENWLDTLTKLYSDSGYSIYLPWGNNIEKQRAQVIAAELPLVVVCDKMNLLQAASLLEQSVSVTGVDTGLLHSANASDKPVAGIYTNTDPIKTGVQVSDWAENLGGMRKIPVSEEVYQVFTDCVAAKKFDLEYKSKSASIETDWKIVGKRLNSNPLKESS